MDGSSGVALSVLDTAPVWQGSSSAQSLRDMIDFPTQLSELLGYFAEPTGDTTFSINAVPAPGQRPSTWLLGSSEQSAELAGALGLPYAYAHHINPSNRAESGAPLLTWPRMRWID